MKPLPANDTRGPGRPRDEEARRRILDAAIQLLEEVGFNAATVDAIAERAGASKATVYRWWPDKASLLIDAFREAADAEVPFPDTGSLAGDIHLQMRNFTSMLMGQKGRVLAAVVAAAQSDPEVAAAFRELWIAERRRETRRVLDRHRKTRELKDVELDLVIDLLYAPLYYQLLTGYRPLSLAYADSIAALALDGLRV